MGDKLRLTTVHPPAIVSINEHFSKQIVVPELGSAESVHRELDEIFAVMKRFATMEPDEVMLHCSAYSARLSEIRMIIHRIEDMHRHWKPVRTREVEPTIEELKFQFNVASRLLSSRAFDYEVTRGQT
jgi:hypothetical protein